MVQKNDLITQVGQPASLPKCVLIGATIGLAVISFFVFGVDHPDPDWGQYWRVRPLLVSPAAGALGGMIFHIMDTMHYRGGWNRALTMTLSIIVFIVGQWLGIVVGLNGTMWN